MAEEKHLDIHFTGYIQHEDDSQSVVIVIICNRIRFCIYVNGQDLGSSDAQEDAADFRSECRHLFQNLPREYEVDDDGPPQNSEIKLADWAIKACRASLGEIVSTNPVDQYATVEEYINPTTYALKLVNIGDALQAERCDIDQSTAAEIHKWCRVRPEDFDSSNAARVPANAVQLISNDGDYHDIAAEKVKLASGSAYFFKRPCLRELQTHQRISKAQKLPTDLRIPHIQGLVEARDGSIVGTLFNLIDMKYDLRAAEAANTTTPFTDRKKWLEQVRYIVSKLHAVGICWGDIQPGNVVIDQEENAWVVDFAGGYTEGFGVNAGNYETEEGDMEGLRYLARYMGIE